MEVRLGRNNLDLKEAGKELRTLHTANPIFRLDII